MKRLLCLSLLLTGCGLSTLQAGLDTAGAVVDTAAVVRARQLGLCGAPAPPLRDEDEMLAMQAEIEQLKRELADMQADLARRAVERARRRAAREKAAEPAPPSSPAP